MDKPIRLPSATFRDLFATWERKTIQEPICTRASVASAPSWCGEGRAYLSPNVQVYVNLGYQSFEFTPGEMLLKYYLEQFLHINGDYAFVQVYPNEKDAHVYLCYGVIIGSHYLQTLPVKEFGF